MKRILPIGNDQFRDVRERGAYYVDKTLMIRDFIEYGNLVALITRPRRFGKTINVTMLRDFFDITQDSRDIFRGLAIMDTEYGALINSRPVICLTFKDCSGRMPDVLRARFNTVIAKEYEKYAGIFAGKVDPEGFYERIFYRDLENLNYSRASFTELSSMVENLMRLVKKFYGKAPVLLLDEYDQPILSSYENGYHDELGDFFSVFYGSALKGNEDLWMALLTGIQRVAKESIFSKLNNIQVYTVLDEEYSEYFGLNEKETEALLENYGLKLNAAVKNKYDGYHIGSQEMYNPWSVLNYASRGVLRNYWVNTSTNYLIHEALKGASGYFMKSFETLLSQGIVETAVTLETSFIEQQNDYSLWGLLVNSGYLTVVEAEDELLMKLRIPNEEVASEFQKMVAEYSHIQNSDLEQMFKSLMKQDLDTFMDIYSRIVLECTSYYDSLENAYHMLFLGMCVSLRGLYRVTSNRESGLGRSDITLEAKRKEDVHVIVEFKQGEEIEALKEEALKQILEHKYYTGLTGQVLCIGLAHNKKQCAMAYETIEA